jgi:hypothetical protein
MSLGKLVKIASPISVNVVTAHAASVRSNISVLLEDLRVGPSILLFGAGFNSGNVLFHSILIPAEVLKTIEPNDLMPRQRNLCGSRTCSSACDDSQSTHVEFDTSLS